MNGFDELALLGGHRRVLQQDGHTHDAIQGRAHFMADIGQELQFDPRRFEGLVARLGQFDLDPFAVGDVNNQCQNATFAIQLDQLGGPEALADFARFGAKRAFIVADKTMLA